MCTNLSIAVHGLLKLRLQLRSSDVLSHQSLLALPARTERLTQVQGAHFSSSACGQSLACLTEMAAYESLDGNKSPPDRRTHIPKEATDVFQEGGLVLMVFLTSQALVSLMLRAQQPAARPGICHNMRNHKERIRASPTHESGEILLQHPAHTCLMSICEAPWAG